ncbi:PilZ domain-containing protein [Aurantiacibacter rhizosphaerae]|uniref:PilZ domain-containing protein n=1 Tax=Aurantiacibacter rhizosphaerae TaxID=2691582 RepID=A0A844XCB0_9SPHN|nr:PilZ domain-containing protein [Aurantiacibacter rhizosphaerae]MWV28141.1 hypothetical protein [Aurantiacibacter rhizosphaerae]
MKLFARTKAAPAADRRAAPRIRVNHPATMVMPSGNRTGRIFDISINGARFVTDDPPATGVGVILDWTMHEAYCQVTWTKPGMCGVQFDRSLPARVVEELSQAAPSGPRPVKSAVTPLPDKAPRHPAPPTRFVG